MKTTLKNYLVPLLLLSLLITLLAFGYSLIKILETSAATILKSTEQVQVYVNNKNWLAAEVTFQQTEKEWKHIRQYWPLLIHHQEMDRIEECMSKIKSYLQHEDSNNTLAEIYVLTSYIKHIPESKALNLQNIF